MLPRLSFHRSKLLLSAIAVAKPRLEPGLINMRDPMYLVVFTNQILRCNVSKPPPPHCAPHCFCSGILECVIVTFSGLFTVPYFCRSFSINLSMGDNTCLR